MDEILIRDENRIPVLGAITNDVAQAIRMLRVDPTTGRLLVSAVIPGTTDGQIKIDSSDTTFGYLANKLVAGTNITLTINNVGGNETLTIDATGGGGGVTGTGTANQVSFWTGASAIGGNSHLTFDPATQEFLLSKDFSGTVSGGIMLSDTTGLGAPGLVIFYSDSVSGATGVNVTGDLTGAGVSGIGTLTGYFNEMTGISSLGIFAGGFMSMQHQDSNSGATSTFSGTATNAFMEYTADGITKNTLNVNVDGLTFGQGATHYLTADITNGIFQLGNPAGPNFSVLNGASQIIANADNGFFVESVAGAVIAAFQPNGGNPAIQLGDTTNLGNSLLWTMTDSASTASLSSNYNGVAGSINFRSHYTPNGAKGITELGDISNNGNSRTWVLNDVLKTIASNTTMIESSIGTAAYGTTLDYSAGFDGNSSAYFSTGTGATTILLPTGTNAPIGTLFTIDDFDAIASTSNITIDAGMGNTINGADILQTYIMDTDGQSITLKKINAIAWKIQ